MRESVKGSTLTIPLKAMPNSITGSCAVCQPRIHTSAWKRQAATVAALILTTQAELGNPERHRKGELYRYLDQSEETTLLALVPGEQAQTILANFGVAEEVIEETLMGEAYGLHAETGIF
jgi:hypothetical protein